jgi:hypothetical protein
MTPEQSRAGRVMVGWGVLDLAREARVSTNTVTRLERGEELGHRTMDAIQGALEKAGCLFVDDERGIGVLLKRKHGRRPRKA